jgi:phosphoribosylformimino-5-aminoimidazole carboxamide ribotide isomerase
MDLKGGHIVRAVGGRRDEYRPIQSRLVESSRPETVAQAFRDKLGLDEIYIADLDAIAGAAPSLELFHALAGMGLRLIVDAGVRSIVRALAIHLSGASGVVVGLETIDDPRVVPDIVDAIGKDAIWFSLDLKNGLPLGNMRAWPSLMPEAIVAEVVAAGVNRFIVLDLARVGERSGTGTEELCRRLIRQHPAIKVVAGGGVRDDTDLHRLSQIGLAGVLVATALHEGRIRCGLSGKIAGREAVPGYASSSGAQSSPS